MRKRGWRTELNNLIRDKANEPFVWGTWDCGLRAAAVCDAVLDTDINYAAPFMGHYSTGIGSLRALKKAGYKDLETYLKECFGDPISIGSAWWGDLAFHEGCVGICLGSYASFIGDEQIITELNSGQRHLVDEVSGVIKIPRNDIKECFKVR